MRYALSLFQNGPNRLSMIFIVVKFEMSIIGIITEVR